MFKRIITGLIKNAVMAIRTRTTRKNPNKTKWPDGTAIRCINFDSIVKTLILKNPDGTEKTRILTPEIKSALGKHLENGAARIDYSLIRLTPTGLPFCTGIVENRETGSKTRFAVFFDKKHYRLDAHITDDPKKWLDENERADPCDEGRGKLAAMKAYVAHLVRDSANPEDRNQIPLYVNREIDLVLNENGIARTKRLKTAMWQEIQASLHDKPVSTINWLAFESVMLFRNNAFANAEPMAFRKCENAGLFKPSNPTLPKNCMQIDVFTDPDSDWPDNDPE